MSGHKPKICLACSAGGHLRELQLAIGDIPNNWNCYWLTLKTTSTKVENERGFYYENETG